LTQCQLASEEVLYHFELIFAGNNYSFLLRWRNYNCVSMGKNYWRNIEELNSCLLWFIFYYHYR